MSLLPIRLYGDPILRQTARPVEEVDEGLRQLAADMAETMRASDGVGLAANQVGALRRVLVVDLEPITGEDRVEAFVNPEIVEEEGKMRLEEGCLSIPDVREEIERSRRVRVRYLDTEGEEKEREVEGLLSAVLQHEIDHLDGVLIVDRISPMRRTMIRSTLKRISKQAAAEA
ncbi:MAG: peptide deformylase [bacterium]